VTIAVLWISVILAFTFSGIRQNISQETKVIILLSHEDATIELKDARWVLL